MAVIDDVYAYVTSILDRAYTIDKLINSIATWLINDQKRMDDFLRGRFTTLELLLANNSRETNTLINSSTQSVIVNTNTQTDRVIDKVNLSTATIGRQIVDSSRVTNDKIDNVTTLLVKLPDQISTKIDDAGDRIVERVTKAVGGIGDTLDKGLSNVVTHIDMLSLNMDNNTSKLVTAVNGGSDRVVHAVDEVREFLTASTRANQEQLMTLLSGHFQQVHLDTVDQTRQLRGAIDGITGTLQTGIAAAAAGVALAIATSTAAEVAAEAPQTIALASIAASLGAIVGGLTLFWGANFTGLLEDPKKWLASLITEISEMYYELGKDTFDATADKADLES